MTKHHSSHTFQIHWLFIFGMILAIPTLLSVAGTRTAIAATIKPGAVAQAAPVDAAAQRKATAERFFDLLFSGRYFAASTYITPVMQSDFSPGALQQKVITFERGAGAFVKRGEAQVEDDIVLIDIQFQRRTVTFVVSFDQNLRIAGANPVIGFIGDETPSSNQSAPNQSAPNQSAPNQSAPNQSAPQPSPQIPPNQTSPNQQPR